MRPVPHARRRPSLRRTSLLLSLLALPVGCRARGGPVEPPAASVADQRLAPPPAAPEPERFGAALGDAPAVTLAEVLRDPGAHGGREWIVEGTVRAVCQAKGCWMELAPDAPAAPGAARPQGARVTFKDYGFFVPRDASGARARVAGTVRVTTVPPELVAHWESEGGSFATKAADGSAQEVRVVAHGVELLR